MTVDRRLAFHEAGHAVIAYILGLEVLEIEMSKNPAYVNIADQADATIDILFLFAGIMAELKDDPKNIYYHEPSEHDQIEINKYLWYIDTNFEIIARSHYYITSSLKRFLDIPEVWAQITALAKVLMNVDRMGNNELTPFLRTVEARA